jgi:dCMP deaminase
MTILSPVACGDYRADVAAMHTVEMTKWDQRFCELARFVSDWSKDPNAKVGAVLFAKRGGDITIGYNGFPAGVEDSADRLQDKDVKLEFIVHAELNAIIAAGRRAIGGTLYVWGKPICARCAGPIIQAGVARVVSLTPESLPPTSSWYKTGKFGYEMFTEAGIQVDFYSVDLLGSLRHDLEVVDGDRNSRDPS